MIIVKQNFFYVLNFRQVKYCAPKTDEGNSRLKYNTYRGRITQIYGGIVVTYLVIKLRCMSNLLILIRDIINKFSHIPIEEA